MSFTKIPIVVVTGALGSGKSALIQDLLSIEPWSASALIINEAGEISIDHQLFGQVAYASENVTAGCICCDGAASLIDRLQDLFWLQLTKKIRPLQQILIEASGIADPAQLYQTLTSDAFISSRFAPPVMLKTIDLLEPRGPIAPEEGVYQVLTKMDLLSPSDQADWKHQLAEGAPVFGSTPYPDATLGAQRFLKSDFLLGLQDLGKRWTEVLAPLPPPEAATDSSTHWPRLTISFTPADAQKLTDPLLMQVYAQHETSLTRLKAKLEDSSGQQRVVDIVRGHLYPSRLLASPDAGPSSHHIVIFGQNEALLRFQIDLRRWLDSQAAV